MMRNSCKKTFRLLFSLFFLTAAHTVVVAQTYTPTEQACYDSIQGKISWEPTGINKLWLPNNLRTLCAGSTDASSTIKCFQGKMPTLGWQQASAQCSNTASSVSSSATLSDADLSAVLNWIAIQVAAIQVPYCYKQTQSNFGKQVPMLGLEECIDNKTGATVACHQACPAGVEKNTSSDGTYSCGPTCAPPLESRALSCYKPADYGRGAGYPWKFGDGLNLNGATQRCEADNGTGKCEQNGAIMYPKCKSGYHNVGCCVCEPDCPQGWESTGADCRPTPSAPAWNSQPAKTDSHAAACKTGYSSYGIDNAQLCYPNCTDPTATFVGPTCTVHCPTDHGVDCGAGCATSSAVCATTTISQVLSPIMLVINIATLGGASEADAEASFLESAGSDVAKEAATLNQDDVPIKTALSEAKLNINDLKSSAAGTVGENGRQVDEGLAIAKLGKATGETVYSEVQAYQTEVATNFSKVTSPAINSAINANFGPKSADYIKQQWGLTHLTLALNQQSTIWDQAQIGLTAGSLDPTGIVGVVSAFAHPICNANTPFPALSKVYPQ